MRKITLVQMNDSHAYFELHSECFYGPNGIDIKPAGGYARLATIVERIRKKTKGNVLFLDGGDTFHGTYGGVKSKGEAMVPVMNALAPDAMTAHWEFAYTPGGFSHIVDKLNYPMLAMNIYRTETGERCFKPYQVFERNGLKIGVAGIASNIVDKTMPAKFSTGIRFTEGKEELPGVVKALREKEKVDLVILLSHLGLPQDMSLVKEIDGVDVVVSAHTHHRLERVIEQSGTLLIQSGSQGSFVTKLELSVVNGKIIDHKHELIPIEESVVPDKKLEKIIAQQLNPYREELGQIVGETDTPLMRFYNLESSMDNLLLDAMLEITTAEVAFSNGWRYGAPVPAGPITLNDLYNMVPGDPVITTVDLKGQEIKEMLEENIERTYSCHAFKQMGGYLKRVRGLRVYFKIENPAGHRIQAIFAGEQRLNPKATYAAAFITEQGVSAKYGSNRKDSKTHIIAALRRYLAKYNPYADDQPAAFQVV